MTSTIQTTQLIQRQARAALVRAVRAEALSEVRRLVSSYPASINAKNAHLNMPLGEAIATDNLSLVRLMVEGSADPANINHGGSGLVGGALHMGYHDIALYLIERRAPTAFAELAACEQPEHLDTLLGSNPNAMNEPAISSRQLTALHMATLAGHLPGVDCLLEHGFDTESRDRHGHPPLACTPECRLTEKRCPVASRLLSADANPSVPGGHHGGTVLDRAIITGHKELSTLLLDAGASLDHQDWSGKTALHHAVSRNADLTRIMLSHSPDIHATTKSGETTIDMARRSIRNAIIRCFEG